MEEPLTPERIFLGTSGYFYPNDWKGIIYPKDLKNSDMLEYYARFFYTTEINSTFYNIPQIRTTEAWANYPLIYSAKIPQLITHEAKLELSQVVDPFTQYLQMMSPLFQQKKVLALLLQLPPSFGNQEELHWDRLERFAQYWQEIVKTKFITHNLEPPYMVVEFRHMNWMKEKTFDLLQEYGLVYCAVVEPKLPPRLDITNEELFYIRFHGFGKKPWFNYNFSREELLKWADNLKSLVPDTQTPSSPRKIAIYFNNHFSGYSVKNALFLARNMNLPVKNQAESLQKPLYALHDPSSSSENKSKQSSLDDFF
jgi:uncharacterized protein YecE (DUF72 family)